MDCLDHKHLWDLLVILVDRLDIYLMKSNGKRLESACPQIDVGEGVVQLDFLTVSLLQDPTDVGAGEQQDAFSSASEQSFHHGALALHLVVQGVNPVVLGHGLPRGFRIDLLAQFANRRHKGTVALVAGGH